MGEQGAVRTAAAPAFEALIDGFYLEGLLIDGDAIWYTDVTQGGVRRAGGDALVCPERTMIGGLLMNHDGRLLVAGGGGIAWGDAAGATGTLFAGVEGTNEMCPDGAGGILFGTIDLPAILRGAKPGPSSIRQLARDGTMRVLYEGLAFANGLAVVGETLFFNESFAATRAFPFADGRLGTPATIADKPDCDGMAVDVDGNLWVTGFASGTLLCLAPDGREVRRIALPGRACTNVRFGGADMRDLYVNVVDPAAAQVLAEGRLPDARTSTLYRTRSPVAGRPVARTGFDLGRTEAGA